MSWITKALGLTLKVPSAGQDNWDQGYLDDFVTPISSHGHTGSGDGKQIDSGAIVNGAIDAVHLSNSSIFHPVIFNKAAICAYNKAEATVRDHDATGDAVDKASSIQNGIVVPYTITSAILRIAAIGNTASQNCTTTIKVYVDGVYLLTSIAVTCVNNTAIVVNNAVATVGVNAGQVLSFTMTGSGASGSNYFAVTLAQ